MDFRIRPARAEDHEAIAAFTANTFAWGDYVADAFPRWLDEPDGRVMVATDDSDVAIAMSRGGLLSSYEAWFQGARVRPDWRRRGIAGHLADALSDWARSRGARVARLIIEGWNEAAMGQVERDQFRRVGDWLACERTVGAASPVPSGNGGRRVPAMERLVGAHSAEAEPAYMSWSAGELGRAARGMFATGWTWRRLHPGDLEDAARVGSFWTARSGWTVAADSGDTLEVGWVETRRQDAADFMRAVVDLAVTRDCENVRLMLPKVAWLVTAARTAGCDARALTLFERAL